MVTKNFTRISKKTAVFCLLLARKFSLTHTQTHSLHFVLRFVIYISFHYVQAIIIRQLDFISVNKKRKEVFFHIQIEHKKTIVEHIVYVIIHKWHGVIAFRMSIDDKLRDSTKIILFFLNWREAERQRQQETSFKWIFTLCFVFIPKDYDYSFKWNSTHEFLSNFVHIFHSITISLLFHSFDFINFAQFVVFSYFFSRKRKKRMRVWWLCSFKGKIRRRRRRRRKIIKIESLFLIRQSLRRISITRTFFPDVL